MSLSFVAVGHMTEVMGNVICLPSFYMLPLKQTNKQKSFLSLWLMLDLSGSHSFRCLMSDCCYRLSQITTLTRVCLFFFFFIECFHFVSVSIHTDTRLLSLSVRTGTLPEKTQKQTKDRDQLYTQTCFAGLSSRIITHTIT